MSRANMPAGTRRAVNARADGRCEHCRKTIRPLFIHHRTPYRETQDHSIENLIALCWDCHEAAHDANEGRGRPPKADDEKYIQWGIRFPPEELAELRRVVPASRRAEFARAAIRRAVREAAKREKVTL